MKILQITSKERIIVSTVLYLFLVLFLFLATILIFYAPESFVTKISLVISLVGLVFTFVLSGKGQIKVAFGKRRFERLAAEVYKAENLDGARVFSVADTFRAPAVYIDAFRNSRAKSIEIIGSAVPKTVSFLGGIFRLIVAQDLLPGRINIYNVDHPRIRVKFIISEVNGKPQRVILGGAVGKASRHGIEVCDINPKMFDLLKEEFDNLFKNSEPMEDYIKRIVLNLYSNTSGQAKTFREFVERVLVPEEVSHDFQDKYGEDILKKVIHYVKDLVENHTKDHGAKINISSETRIPPLKKEEIKQLVEFLENRTKTKEASKTLSIILDLTYFCNLDCKGCGVDVKFVGDYSGDIDWELSFVDAQAVMQGIAQFAREKEITDNIRFCIGGGEPTLHPDFEHIVRYAGELFGNQNVSFDTNGTVLSAERLRKIVPYVANIGVGLDGDAEYHDKWRNHREKLKLNVFRKVTGLIESVKKYNEIIDKIEIIFTPTAENCHQFKHVARIVQNLGVKRLSCHRFMLTGRACNKPELEPSAEQYLRLFVDTVAIQKESGLDVHFHHSFEELFCRILDSDVPQSDMVTPCKARRASLCISADLKMHFCPWFVAHPFNKDLGISIQPFLKRDNGKKAFYNIGEVIASLREYDFKKSVCPIAAASTRFGKSRGQSIQKNELIKCLSAEDNCERQIRAFFESNRAGLMSG